MLNRILLISAGLVLVSGAAVANPDNKTFTPTTPSTTGTAAMEKPSSEIGDTNSSRQERSGDRTTDAGSESGMGTMGTGASGTTGGDGATTGTDTIEGRDDGNTDQ